jgi:hypothetical protein
MKIIIFDDNGIDEKVLKNFELLGHTVEVFHKSTKVYAHLNELKTEKKDLPELCFFDINLDIESPLDGIDVASKVIKEYQIPVVLYSQRVYSEENGDSYALKVKAMNFSRAFYVPREELNVKEKLQQLIEDVEDNYEHPDIPPTLSDEEFDLGNLKIGLRKRQGEPYEFYSKDQIYYLEGDRNYSKIHVYDNISNNFVEITLAINLGGRESNINFGLGDKIKRIFKNFHPLGDKLFVNLEKIKCYDNGSLYLEGVEKGIILDESAKRALKKMKLLITTERERK